MNDTNTINERRVFDCFGNDVSTLRFNRPNSHCLLIHCDKDIALFTEQGSGQIVLKKQSNMSRSDVSGVVSIGGLLHVILTPSGLVSFSQGADGKLYIRLFCVSE